MDYLRFHRYQHHTYEARSDLGYVLAAGFHLAGSGEPVPRQLGFYVLIYVVRGQAIYRSAHDYKAMIEPGSLLIIQPNVKHSYQPIASEPWSEIWFCFNGRVFDLWRQSGLFGESASIRRLMPVEYWHNRFGIVLERGEQSGRSGGLRVICALQDVLAEAVGDGHHSADADQLWLMQASSLMSAKEHEVAPSIEDIAEQMNLSYDQFRRRFTKLSGFSPNAFRTAKIMDRACRLIVEEGLTNRQIADRCGFSSEFHFSRRFKQIVGMAPREFRKTAASREEAEAENHKPSGGD